MVIFHSYVSLPEGTLVFNPRPFPQLQCSKRLLLHDLQLLRRRLFVPKGAEPLRRGAMVQQRRQQTGAGG